MIVQAVMLITSVPYGNRVPNLPDTTEPTQNLAIDPNEPPRAISKYFFTGVFPFQCRYAVGTNLGWFVNTVLPSCVRSLSGVKCLPAEFLFNF